MHGAPHGLGSVIDFAIRTADKTWPIPGGGGPDMGNVSLDGKVVDFRREGFGEAHASALAGRATSPDKAG